VQLYPKPLYTASYVRTTSRSWDKGVLNDLCLTLDYGVQFYNLKIIQIKFKYCLLRNKLNNGMYFVKDLKKMCTIYTCREIKKYLLLNYLNMIVVLFSWRYNPLWLYFHSPVPGFSLLVFEVSWTHTTTRHIR
jgi:hypothetical protein